MKKHTYSITGIDAHGYLREPIETRCRLYSTMREAVNAAQAAYTPGDTVTVTRETVSGCRIVATQDVKTFII